MAQTSKELHVAIDNAVFAKEYNYFVVLQLDKGKKKRTEVQKNSKKPKFTKREFTLNLREAVDESNDSRLEIGAFIADNKSTEAGGKNGAKGARLLGGAVVHLKNFVTRLLRGETVTENLQLTKTKQGKDGKATRTIVVGKLSATMHLVGLGDGVTAESAKETTSVATIIVRNAVNLPNDGTTGTEPSTLVEARVLTKLQNREMQELVDAEMDLWKVLRGAKDAAGRKRAERGRQDIERKREKGARLRPKSLAETRTVTDSKDPAWHELMSVPIKKKYQEKGEGSVLRLDIVESLTRNENLGWKTLGGCSLPIDLLLPGHQYDMEIELGEDDGAGNVCTLFVSISVRASVEIEKMRFKGRSGAERLAINVKRIDTPFSFSCREITTAVKLLRDDEVAMVKKAMDEIADGSTSATPKVPVIRLKYSTAKRTPLLELLEKGQTDFAASQSMVKLSPSVRPGASPARFEFSAEFDVGFEYDKENNLPDYPKAVITDYDGELTSETTIQFLFFRRNARSGQSVENELACAPEVLLGYALLPVPTDITTQGDPLGVQNIPIIMLPPGGVAVKSNGSLTKGPMLRVTLRLWDAKHMNAHLLGGHPMDKTTAKVKYIQAPIPEALEGEIDNEVEEKDTADDEEDTDDDMVMTDTDDDIDDMEEGEEEEEEDDEDDGEGNDGGGDDDDEDEDDDDDDDDDDDEGLEQKKDTFALPSKSNKLPVSESVRRKNTPVEGDGGYSSGLYESQTVHKRLNVLTEDIAHKQELIDRLLKEVDKRSDAIRVCGAEIVELRRKNKAQAKEIDKLNSHIENMEEMAAQEVERLNQTEDVEGFGRDGTGGNPKELAKRLHLVAAKYKTERERSHKIEVRLRQIKARERDYRSRDSRIKDLENAHMQQARVMQKLQADNKKIGAYKSTVKFQEKVIAKLENLLESKMKENAVGAAGGMQLARLKKQVEHLARRNQELEKNGVAASQAATVADSATVMDDDTIRELERLREIADEFEVAKARVQALEEQLVENAKDFSAELAELKMKVFEFEAERGDFAGMEVAPVPPPPQTEGGGVPSMHPKTGQLRNRRPENLEPLT